MSTCLQSSLWHMHIHVFFMFSSKSSTHVYTASMWKRHRKITESRGFSAGYHPWIPHHSLPRIQRIQNAECPTSMRVGNITPAAEIPCQIPTIWTPWRLRYFFQLTSWDASKPMLKQLVEIFTKHIIWCFIILCAVFQLYNWFHPSSTCHIVNILH